MVMAGMAAVSKMVWQDLPEYLVRREHCQVALLMSRTLSAVLVVVDGELRLIGRHGKGRREAGWFGADAERWYGLRIDKRKASRCERIP